MAKLHAFNNVSEALALDQRMQHGTFIPVIYNGMVSEALALDQRMQLDIIPSIFLGTPSQRHLR